MMLPEDKMMSIQGVKIKKQNQIKIKRTQIDFKALLNAIISLELNEKQQIDQLKGNAKLLLENVEISRSIVD